MNKFYKEIMLKPMTNRHFMTKIFNPNMLFWFLVALKFLLLHFEAEALQNAPTSPDSMYNFASN